MAQLTDVVDIDGAVDMASTGCRLPGATRDTSQLDGTLTQSAVLDSASQRYMQMRKPV